MRGLVILVLGVLATAGVIVACGDTCVPGAAQPCTCSGGGKGAEVCQEDGTAGRCVCDRPGALLDGGAPR